MAQDNKNQIFSIDMQHSDEFPYANKFDWHNKVFLGEGSYGKVYKARNTIDGQFYAIKQMDMTHFNQDPQLMESLKGQINITTAVNSEHTVKMLQYSVGHHFTYMVLELCDGDLRDQITNNKFTQPQCVNIFDEIMQGMKTLVDKGFIHRDIKPANVLVKNKHYKVADFGFATRADVSGKQKMMDICGTPIYMAPQLLENKPYTAKSDVWSLGLLLYEMIYGFPPWPCRSIDQYLFSINSRPVSFPFNGKIGQNTKDFIQKALTKDEQKRMGWPEIFSHPLICKLEAGQQIEPVEVNHYIKGLLMKLQNHIKAYKVNVCQILTYYEGYQFDEANFGFLLKDIDKSITSHEIYELYKFLDKQHTGVIPIQIIHEYIANTDFRDANDAVSRLVDQIVGIIRMKNLDPLKLFANVDLNKSGQLDWKEFSQFIVAIAPKYTVNEISKLYQKIDADNSGLISQHEFMKMINYRLPQEKVNGGIQQQRAMRNLCEFQEYLKYSQVSPQTIMKIADKDHSFTIELHELENLLQQLEFYISKEEAAELFSYINQQNNGKISYNELMELLK